MTVYANHSGLELSSVDSISCHVLSFIFIFHPLYANAEELSQCVICKTNAYKQSLISEYILDRSYRKEAVKRDYYIVDEINS